MDGDGLYPKIPPDALTREQVNPILLMSWWATAFSLAIIVVRLCGRYIRIERFFTEDKLMMVSVIPLTVRMIIVHYVLVLGTNNVKTIGLTAEQISNREMGSKLVLAARIFYAIFIWTAKLVVCEFLKRVTGMTWKRSAALFLRFLYFFLASTFVVVVVATLAECQPFDHYWQVRPDPGPSCRSGFANLIAMGTCDVITDLLLIAFPVPIILMAQMPVKRKIFLVILFCLSLVLVAITCYRVPSVIEHKGAQPYRSLIASLEILAATAVSNMVVIGSFVRDRGVKKLKYKRDQGSASVTESMDHSHVRRNTVMQHQWGSDSDLAADLGIRLDPKLHSSAPAATAEPLSNLPTPLSVARTGSINRSWSFQQGQDRPLEDDQDHVSATDSLELKVSPHEYIETTQSPRKDSSTPASSPTSPSSHGVSFFDVGGLLNQEEPQPPRPRPRPQAFFSSPASVHHPQPRIRRGSRAFLEDLGVLSPRTTTLAPPPPTALTSPPSQSPINPRSSTRQISSHSLLPYRVSSDISPEEDMELHDVGGLLSPGHHPLVPGG